MTTTTLVVAQVAESILTELTNTSSSASASDSTVLASAVTTGEGLFYSLTGIRPDSDVDYHQALLVDCVVYVLEKNKIRDVKTRRDRMAWLRDCAKDLRERIVASPQTTSPLATTVAEDAGDYADFDKRRFVRGIVGENTNSSSLTTTSPDD